MAVYCVMPDIRLHSLQPPVIRRGESAPDGCALPLLRAPFQGTGMLDCEDSCDVGGWAVLRLAHRPCHVFRPITADTTTLDTNRSPGPFAISRHVDYRHANMGYLLGACAGACACILVIHQCVRGQAMATTAWHDTASRITEGSNLRVLVVDL